MNEVGWVAGDRRVRLVVDEIRDVVSSFSRRERRVRERMVGSCVSGGHVQCRCGGLE